MRKCDSVEGFLFLTRKGKKMMNYSKIVLSVLKELSNGEIPTNENYDLTPQQFADIVNGIQDEGYIKNVIDASSFEERAVLLDGARVTPKGMNYLESQSGVMKFYNGLKEVRDWIKP